MDDVDRDALIRDLARLSEGAVQAGCFLRDDYETPITAGIKLAAGGCDDYCDECAELLVGLCRRIEGVDADDERFRLYQRDPYQELAEYPEHCYVCAAPLAYALTSTGVANEIAHLEEHGFGDGRPTDAYALLRLLEDGTHEDGTQDLLGAIRTWTDAVLARREAEPRQPAPAGP